MLRQLAADQAAVRAAIGALTDDEANILAALREQPVGVTPEQHAAIIAQQLPGAVLTALVTLLGDQLTGSHQCLGEGQAAQRPRSSPECMRQKLSGPVRS